MRLKQNDGCYFYLAMGAICIVYIIVYVCFFNGWVAVFFLNLIMVEVQAKNLHQ